MHQDSGTRDKSSPTRLRRLSVYIIIVILLAGTCLVFEYPQYAAKGKLFIAEYMISNTTTFPDSDGDYPDWIELANRGPFPINLDGYGLSDDPIEPVKWKLPCIIVKPGQHILIFASGKDRNEPAEPHTSFKLSAFDEAIILSNAAGKPLDRVDLRALDNDVSFGRQSDKWSGWQVFSRPTPGFSNDETGHTAFMKSERMSNPGVLVNEIMAANQSTVLDSAGYFSDWIEVVNISGRDMNLEGFAFSDDETILDKWRFPSMPLGAEEYLLVFASGLDAVMPDGQLHTNFRLNAGEDNLLLSDPEGKILDKIKIEDHQPDRSLGRGSGGDFNKWRYFDSPTPGHGNTPEGIREFALENLSLSDGLYISEVGVTGESRIMDEDEEFTDWIELSNGGQSVLDLSAYYLSDNGHDPFKWALPDISLHPSARLLVYASGKDRNGSVHHANFRLSPGGDSLYLRNASGEILEKLVIPQIPNGASYGRGTDTTARTFFMEPTPGEENTLGCGPPPGPPLFSHPSGYYKNTIVLTIESDGGLIRYTLDGSEPDDISPLYSSPIALTNTAVVRARVFFQGSLPGKIATHTYIFGNRHDLPVVSLSTTPRNLWDEDEGIYVMGTGAESVFPYMGANFWMKWEKPAHVDYIDSEGISRLNENAGLRIFGSFSRGFPQKSFLITARQRYEQRRFRFQLLPGQPVYSYRSFVLRAAGQDAFASRFKDPLASWCALEMGLDAQDWSPVAVYLNGHYWGHYNIREKVDEYFLAARYGIPDPANIDLIEGFGILKAGDMDAFVDLILLARNNDLRIAENYAAIGEKMDIINFIDFIITDMYFGDIDNGNTRCWREKTETRKWRWIVYDNDAGFTDFRHDTIVQFLAPPENGNENNYINEIFLELLQNPTFKEMMINRFMYHMKNTFDPRIMSAKIDETARRVEPEILNHFARWGGSLDKWKYQIEYLKNFTKRRPAYLVGLLAEHLGRTEGALWAIADDRGLSIQ